ncbi:MAG: hypothetical protein PHH48_04975 [Eubacteriales bacterium]|nr:hypothetical protein [Eubacteriales bacterium]
MHFGKNLIRASNDNILYMPGFQSCKCVVTEPNLMLEVISPHGFSIKNAEGFLKYYKIIEEGKKIGL